MKTFLQDVVTQFDIDSIDNYSFIFPSKRAGLFFKRELLNQIEGTIISPEIVSIEEFIESVSELITINNTESLFVLYEVYLLQTSKEEKDSFEDFSKWAQMLIQDFNEIDRYDIDSNQIFNYLASIKELEHWSKNLTNSDIVSNYLEFWNSLEALYISFSKNLLENKKGYQGLVYKTAKNNISEYIKNTNKTHVFIGFNALNTCEEIIFKKFKASKVGLFFWDIDSFFYQQKFHSAGKFIRSFKEKNLVDEAAVTTLKKNYTQPKSIEVYGTQKNVAQAKLVGQILKNIDANKLSKTALVLGDETLLLPILGSLPENVSNVNITMGLPLNLSSLCHLFHLIFKLKTRKEDQIYYKDLFSILSNDYIQPIIYSGKKDFTVEALKSSNEVYFTLVQIYDSFPESKSILSAIFSKDLTVKEALENFHFLINAIKDDIVNDASKTIDLEYLYKFNNIFTQLIDLNEKFSHLDTITGLYELFKELVSKETLDIKGEALEGLQIMGMLESRVLDFETVILTSVNEGILPSGKSNNSFIPFDLKTEYGLPTYSDKDAVYTYHFYHLLQRAKNVHIIYNTEMDALLGGEKSRFIHQLETEGVHQIKQHIISAKIPTYAEDLKKISKTPAVLSAIEQLAQKGFSPSSLTNYMRNPIDFYYEKILGVKKQEEIEETIAANTLGTIVHEVLEDFYMPFISTLLEVDKLEHLKDQIHQRVSFYFEKFYENGDVTKGINLIIFEIAKRYILNFLNFEISELKKGHQIKIIALEQKNELVLNLPTVNFPVKIRGTVDRVDEFNGITRIIDYKTGKVTQDKVRIKDWESITLDYDKYSKPFQILIYALMMKPTNDIKLPIQAGIISFKNLKAGFIPFQKQISYGKYSDSLDSEILENFKKELIGLIEEICNKTIDFKEKEIPTFNF